MLWRFFSVTKCHCIQKKAKCTAAMCCLCTANKCLPCVPAFIYSTGAACRSTKRSTHARPGMHVQQCSAVPAQFHCATSGPSYVKPANIRFVPLSLSCVLSAKTSSLHATIRGHWSTGQHIKLARCWHYGGQLVAPPLSQGQRMVCACVQAGAPKRCSYTLLLMAWDQRRQCFLVELTADINLQRLRK